MQLFRIFICIDRTGPRGGRGKPVKSEYVVLANTSDEARELFLQNYSCYADDIAAITPYDDVIARIA
jgi:hypothetical protein